MWSDAECSLHAFTLYWLDRINYLAAGLLAVITEKERTAS